MAGRFFEGLGLEKFAEMLGFEYPEDIYPFADGEKWWGREDITGDIILDVDAINDTMNRMHANIIVTSVGVSVNDYISGFEEIEQ